MTRPFNVPRRDLKPNTVLAYQFPESKPIFWGPNQKIKEDDIYVEPTGWTYNEYLSHPFVVRFIHDAHEVDTTPQPSCTYQLNSIAVSTRRKLGTYIGEEFWNDIITGPVNPDPDIDYPNRGVQQNLTLDTYDWIIANPNVTFNNKHNPWPFSRIGHFNEVIAASHYEITGFLLSWLWFDEFAIVIGGTGRFVQLETPTQNPTDVSAYVVPRCPEDYLGGCECP